MATLSVSELLNGRRRNTILKGHYALGELVKAASELKTPRFISFVYENEYEISAVTVLVGIRLENAYRRDLTVLEEVNRHETDATRKLAINEHMESLRESLEKGIGNNSRYTCKDVYSHVKGNGSVKVHDDNGMVYLTATVIRKRVLVKKADRKAVNSSAKTIAKNQIKNEYCKMSQFRQYKLDAGSISSVSFAKNRIIFNSEKYDKLTKIARNQGRPLTMDEYNAL